ncbi:unnamed protein product [Cyprideis torosa]|uniref:Uncharacterized protein n=1 Tax=Cyprideis torosa TaxID=163714 RepID=A0A7R8W6B3_9CRUS|nr:unnamed protein product [Cyprideis torosa]CAG0886320.1 unnamed protein product [Cyprideis torosa]
MNSRLFVKNLPKSVTAEKVKQVFSQKGRVTDVQLKYDAKGKFRHFGYVGFKTADEAKEALEYFNNSCIGGSKIAVQECRDLSSVLRSEVPTAVEKEGTGKAGPPRKRSRKPEDPEFKEFVELHEKKRRKGFRNPDADERESDEDVQTSNGNNSDGSNSDGNDSDDSEEEAENVSNMEFLRSKISDEIESERTSQVQEKSKDPKPTKQFLYVKLRNLPYKIKKSVLKEFFKPMKIRSLRIPPAKSGVKGIAFVGFATEKELKQAMLKNKSIIKGHRIHVTKYNQKSSSEADVSSGGKTKKAPENTWRKKEEELLKTTEAIGESGRIFVRNLSYETNEEEIEELFSKYGTLTETLLPINKETRKPMGIAFVTFMFPEQAEKAYQELDGTSFQGRLLHLLPSKPPKRSEVAEGTAESTGMTFKQKQALKAKASAPTSWHQWNTLFLGPNAVAESVAQAYDTEKRDVLSSESGAKESVAVRLALGESEIVAKTRRFLEENGVRLEAFSNGPPAASSKLSKTAFLVKNLPAGTVPRELMPLLSKYGVVARVILPPSGVTALVEFVEAVEARAAFHGLAYTHFKRGAPLYLEWAPSETFSRPPAPEDETGGAEDASSRTKEPEGETEEPEERPQEQEPEEGTMLFVKNLNFDTTDETLLEHFKAIGPVRSAQVSRRKSPKSDAVLSNGYGFVQYLKKSSADKALRMLQRTFIDGHPIEIKPSHRTTVGQLPEVRASVVRKATSNDKPLTPKLLVKNVPFQATKKELLDLFMTFGEIRSVRLPSKVGGSHRGFAFVEFTSQANAKRAFEALVHSTHLYGRRLVLEWAQANESLEDLRKKTASRFVASKAVRDLEEVLERSASADKDD